MNLKIEVEEAIIYEERESHRTSDVIREYIETPKAELFAKSFENDT